MTVYRFVPTPTNLCGIPRPCKPISIDTDQEFQEATISSTGQRYGFSHYSGKNTKVSVFHLTDGIPLYEWKERIVNALKKQRVTVYAFIGTKRVGHARFCRYAVEDGSEFFHSSIWCAAHVETKDEFRRRGVAQAMYSHIYLYGYKLSPAPVIVRAGAKEMWRKFDPNIQFPLSDHEAIERLPSLPMPRNLQDEAELQKAARRFLPQSSDGKGEICFRQNFSLWMGFEFKQDTIDRR